MVLQIRRLVSALVPAVLVLVAPTAWAHCDTLAGPVVTAARAALVKNDLAPLLKWVKPEAEAELKAAFALALRVRREGGAARDLADRFFFETAVRLHRTGEGAGYTGLKAGVDDPGGLIAASDKALESGSVDVVARLITSQIASGLRERHQRVVDAGRHADQSVEAGRQYVDAYVEYVHYVESLQQLGVKAPVSDAVHRHEK